MDIMFYVVASIVATGVLLLIAEPYRFFPQEKERKKMVGSSYWGVYEGSDLKEPESQRTIEIKKSTRKDKFIAGSTTYAAGRGVKMSGH